MAGDSKYGYTTYVRCQIAHSLNDLSEASLNRAPRSFSIAEKYVTEFPAKDPYG